MLHGNCPLTFIFSRLINMFVILSVSQTIILVFWKSCIYSSSAEIFEYLSLSLLFVVIELYLFVFFKSENKLPFFTLPTKEHCNTQMLLETLSVLLMFSKLTVVLFHLYSYIFIIINNSIKIFASFSGIHAGMTSKGQQKNLLCIWDSCFLCGCCAWRHFDVENNS